MRIILDKAYTPYTDDVVGFDCDAHTLDQAFAVLFAEFPRLTMFLSADGGKEASRTCAKLNGIYLEDLSELYLTTSEDDVLEITSEVPDGSGKGMGFLPGILMILASFVVPGLAPATIAMLQISGGISLAVAGIGMLLAPSPYTPGVSSADNSPTLYGFDGVKNTTEPGTPVPIVYGRRRIGGHTLGLHTEAVELGQILYGMLGLCEGKIQEVEYDETHFNTLPVSAYNRWAQVARLGSVNQTGNENAVQEDRFAVGTSSWSDLQQSAADLGRYTVYASRGALVKYMVPFYFEYILDSNGTTVWAGVEYSISNYMIPSASWTGDDGSSSQQLTEGFLVCDVHSIRNGQVVEHVSRQVTGRGERFITGGRSTYTGAVQWDNSDPTLSYRVLFYSVSIPIGESIHTDIPDVTYPTTSLSEHAIQWVGNPLWYWDFKTGTAQVSGIVSGQQPAEITVSGALPQFNKIANTTSFGDNKRVTETGAIYITESAASSVKVVVGANSLYDARDGMEPTQVDYTVTWKPTTGGGAEESRTEFIKQLTKSEYFGVTSISSLNPDLRYEITVTRATPESDSLSVSDTIYLKEVTEEIGGTFIYPNTALLGYGIVATDQLNGAPPTVSTVVKGKLVHMPAGYNGETRTWDTPKGTAGSTTFTTLESEKRYTNNPAYILYDILTNTETGLGEYCNFSNDVLLSMQANFIEAADKCDVRAYYDNSPRFSCNLVMNNTSSAREWLSAITQTMRATLYYTNGGLYVDIDDSGKLLTQLFNQSNLKDFTVSYSSRKYPNVIEVQYTNEANNFENEVLLIEDPSLQTDPSIERRTKTISMAGTTSRSQALSLGRYVMLMGKMCSRTVSFKTGSEGLIASIGDIIGVQHDSTEWGHGGRITNIAGDTITIDSPFDMEPGSYKIRVSSRTAGTGSEEETIQSFNTTNRTLTFTPPGSFTMAVGDLVVFGPATQSVKPFRILTLKRSDVEEVEITGIEYNEELYSLVESTDWSDSVLYDDYIKPVDNRRSASNVVAEPKYYQDSSGNWKVGIEVWYTKPVLSIWSGAILNWKHADDTNYTTTLVDDTGYFSIPEVTKAGEYSLVVTSVYTTGHQTMQEALSDLTNHPWVNINITMYLPGTSFLEGVTGLRIEGASTDGTFTGKDCVVVWNKPTIIDQALAGSAGSEQWGAGTTTTSQMLKDYTIVVSNTDGTVRRVMFGVNTERFVYTHEMNHEDAKVVRQFKIAVTATDRLGRSSSPVEVVCFNPAPLKVQ